MPRVTLVKKAQKDQGACRRCGTEIKTGDPYRWFANRIGRSSIRKNFCEKCVPRPSDLTTSDKLSQLYTAQEGLEDAIAAAGSVDDLACALREAAGEANEVAEAYRDSISNMPDSLQQGSQADEMEEKASSCEEWAQNLEQAADEIEAMEPDEVDSEEEDEQEAALEALLESARTRADDAAGELSI